MKIKITDTHGNINEGDGFPFIVHGLIVGKTGAGVFDRMEVKSLDYARWFVWFNDFEMEIDGVRFEKERYDHERKQSAAEANYIRDMGMDISDTDPGL